MSRPIRAFLMVRDCAEEWTASVCRDLEAVEDIWKAQGRGQTAVLHTGFDRPASGAFEHVAARFPGKLLVTAAAKFGLPSGSTFSRLPVGFVEEIPVHLVLQGWGYTAEDPGNPPVEVNPRAVSIDPRGWVAKFLTTRADFTCEFEKAGIFDEDSYQSCEHFLDWEARHRSGLFRLRSLTEGEEWNPCVIAAASPPWFIDRKLESLVLTVRVENVLQKANIQTIGDLAELNFADLFRMSNFGRKSAADLRASLLAALQDGPPVGPLKVRGLHVDSSAEGRPRGISATLLANLHGTIGRLSDRERDVLTRRMGLGGSPETLEAISKDYGVTRERIRQIEVKAVKKIIKEEDWDDLLSAKLEKLLVGREFPLPVLGIEAVDEWFRGISRDVGALRYILANFCGDHIGVTTVDGVEYFGFLSQSDWDRALFEARRTLRYGAEQSWPEAHCKAVVMPILGESTREFRSLLWEKATETCHFTVSPEGVRTLVREGRGIDGLVDAVLLEAERPLHYTELSERASARAGRKVDIGSVRNAASSTSILLGRGVYGREKHIALSSEEMELVRQEAEGLLVGGPAGRQWHASEVLASLLEMDVAPPGLDAYVLDYLLRSVETIRRLGRMTWVVAQAGGDIATNRIEIRQAVLAFVQEAGHALSTAELKQRLVAVRGVSQNLQITPVDPLVRIGPGLWGLNDRDVPIKRADQARLCDDVVAILERRGVGLHISEISDELGPAWPDTPPRILFALAALDPRLRVNTGQYLYLDEWGDPRRKSLYDTLKRVLAEANQPLTVEQVTIRATREIGREPNKKQVSGCLQMVGAFDRETALWTLEASAPEVGSDDGGVTGAGGPDTRF